MDNFFQITISDDQKYDEVTIRTQNNQVCVCCLTKNGPFVDLMKCSHATVFECIFGHKSAILCLLCHSLLKKIDTFKNKVQENFVLLNEKAEHLNAHTNIYNLTHTSIEVNYTVNSEPITTDIIPSINNEINYEMETEIKIEYDSETDVPLSVIKIKKHKPKTKARKEKKKKRPRTALQEQYEGKIEIIKLSMEQLMEQRRMEADNPKYLNLPYRCEFCITGFDHEITLKDHMEKRHKETEGSIVCEICKSVLRSKMSFDEHYKRHFRRYECMVCGKRNNNVYPLLRHYSVNHGGMGTVFTCKQCDFTTESHSSYRYHRERHRAKVECPTCGNSYANRAGLRVHMLAIHGTKTRAYACNVCGGTYRSKSGLLAHAASHAATPVRAYCPPCDKHFKTQNALKHHLSTNSKHVRETDKRFTCDTCNAKFVTKSLLREHIDWEHLKKMKYSCTKCTKVFKNNSGLKKHKAYVHDKKRPPRNKICDHCGRGFTTLQILQSHIRTHTGERPLRCAHCTATFAYSAARYTHTRLLHAH